MAYKNSRYNTLVFLHCTYLYLRLYTKLLPSFSAMAFLVSSRRLLTAESPTASVTIRPTGRDSSSLVRFRLSLRESCVSKRSLNSTAAVSWSITRRLMPRLKFLWKAYPPVDRPEAGTLRVSRVHETLSVPWSSRVPPLITPMNLRPRPGVSATAVLSERPIRAMVA